MQGWMRKGVRASISWEMTTYQVSHTLWIYLTLTTSPWGKYYNPHFTDQDTHYPSNYNTTALWSQYWNKGLTTLTPKLCPSYYTSGYNQPNVYFFRLPPFCITQFHGSLGSRSALTLPYHDTKSLDNGFFISLIFFKKLFSS